MTVELTFYLFIYPFIYHLYILFYRISAKHLEEFVLVIIVAKATTLFPS